MMKKMTQTYRTRRKDKNINSKQSKLICLKIRFHNIDRDEANRLMKKLWTKIEI